MSYRITAQSYVDNIRINKTVQAVSEMAALKSVASTLEGAGFYVVEVKPL